MGFWGTTLVSSREPLWWASISRSKPEGEKDEASGKARSTWNAAVRMHKEPTPLQSSELVEARLSLAGSTQAMMRTRHNISDVEIYRRHGARDTLHA